MVSEYRTRGRGRYDRFGWKCDGSVQERAGTQLDVAFRHDALGHTLSTARRFIQVAGNSRRVACQVPHGNLAGVVGPASSVEALRERCRETRRNRRIEFDQVPFVQTENGGSREYFVDARDVERCRGRHRRAVGARHSRGAGPRKRPVVALNVENGVRHSRPLREANEFAVEVRTRRCCRH